MAPTPARSLSEGVRILPTLEPHHASWRQLYLAYAHFYRTSLDEAALDRVWGWLQDDVHPLVGRVAIAPGGGPGDSGVEEVIGLIHFRPVPVPLEACDAGFVDDLFVDPAWRGSGVAEALMAAAAAEGRRRGWSSLQWVTADDNHRARALYDRIAEHTTWVTYEMTLSQSPPASPAPPH
jgi:GNAT superfamily N-acetyltransferase